MKGVLAKLATMARLRNQYFDLTVGQRGRLKAIVESRAAHKNARLDTALIHLGLAVRGDHELVATKAGRYIARLY
jgi:hypothetical protein